MVAGLGSLVNSDNSMMMKLISDISSLDAYQKATESKENGDNSSVEDIFSQIIDNINDNIEKNVAAEAGLTSPLGDTSNAQFGPPAGMEIDGLDTDSLNTIDSISSRGDGFWGKDLINHLSRFIPTEYVKLGGHYTLRGEVLVKKQIFLDKYAEHFTNPRSFVSGVLNRDYEANDQEFMEMLILVGMLS